MAPSAPGGAVVSLVEPHAGHARAFHRWYERDHFHAGCMAGPGFFAGRRFVSTPELAALREAAAAPAWPGGRERGRFLTLYWLDADALQEAIDWSIARFHALRDAGRIFERADLVYGGFLDVAAAVERDPDGVPPALALDHPFAGVVMTLVETPEHDALRRWIAAHVARGPVALSVELVPRPRPPGALRAADPAAHPDRTCWLHFTETDPAAVWRDAFAGRARRMEADGVGRALLVAGFVPTVPGTDRHVEEV